MEPKGISHLLTPLTANEIEFRVGSVVTNGDKNKAWANILAYKDARVDMKILDEAVGAMGWQTRYERDSKGVLQCGIGIKDVTTGEWVWKWSNGVESNAEAEKGEYSDAFKRAGFMWGIGRHLYDAGQIFVELVPSEEWKLNGEKAVATTKLKPRDWVWEVKDGKIISAKYKNVTRWYAK